MNHEEAKRRLLENPEVRRAYENPPFPLAVARAVVERRRELGMSQEELAGKLGSSQSQVWRIESGHANPRASTLSKLEEVLGISLRPTESKTEQLGGTLPLLEQLDEWRRTGRLIMSDVDFQFVLALEESNPEYLSILVRFVRTNLAGLEEDEGMHVMVEVRVRHDESEAEEELAEPLSGFDLRASLSFA